MDPVLPQRFKERYSSIVDDPEALFTCLMSMPPKSFRVNTLKTSAENVKARFNEYGLKITGVPWSNGAFTTDSLEIGSTLEHFLGHIYIQELSSMLPPIIMQKEIEQSHLVLDACAAPGSKSTQISAIMQNSGTLVANDVDYGRIRALKFNLEKCGVLNSVIINQDLRYFPNLQFDSVLLDAPCSAEGTIRKSYSALKLWSEKKVFGSAKLQQQLITKAYDLLKPGGVMVYSTCTFAPEEDEAIIDWLIQKRPDAKLENISIEGLKYSHGIEDWNGLKFSDEVRKAIRIFPHYNNSEGFFLAKVKKND
ncbi:NOL1/NOP2/sun family putative RNA methylase [Candidatus Micrarchaeota archaeon]|nr:NOL1/NOP2/sun family putative RNA methylase [Candidatus Micrarchaeota archaeon]